MTYLLVLYGGECESSLPRQANSGLLACPECDFGRLIAHWTLLNFPVPTFPPEDEAEGYFPPQSCLHAI